MVEGLEIVIKYHGMKSYRVAFPKCTSSEFAILKKDLTHLRVHSPSQTNIRRVNDSFVLHWPNASLGKKALNNSLYTRWIKLCSDDRQASRLRQVLSIESITMKQDGILMFSTPLSPKNVVLMAPLTPGHPSLMDPPHDSPTKQPRTDIPHLKRRKSTPDADGPPNPTRQKLGNAPEDAFIDTQLQPTSPTTTQPPALPQLAPSPSSAEPQSMEISPPPLESRKVTRSASAGSGSGSDASLSGARVPLLIPRSGPWRYRDAASSSSPSGSAGHCSRQSPLSLHPPQPQPQDTPRRPDHDVHQLTRELWDTRRELAAMRTREQTILGDLARLGVQVTRTEGGGEADQSEAVVVSREGLQALEAELRVERARRVRAERMLGDVERECRVPFVVPVLFQAFMSISELSN